MTLEPHHHEHDPVDPALAETVSDFELEQMEAGLSPVADEPTSTLIENEREEDGEFEADEQLLTGYDPEADVHNTRVHRIRQKKQRKRLRKHMLSEGAQFIYGLVILAGTLGLIALATTIQSVELIITAMIICPLVVWYAVLSWKRWLRGAPYVYRLLTSLGEDAENLVQFRFRFFRF